MNHPIKISLFLISALVLSIIFLVDNFSDEKILPQSISTLSLSGFSLKSIERSVYRFKYQAQQKWRDLTGKETVQKIQGWSTLKNRSSLDGEIVKWRDKHGVWHFEQKTMGSEGEVSKGTQISNIEKQAE